MYGEEERLFTMEIPGGKMGSASGLIYVVSPLRGTDIYMVVLLLLMFSKCIHINSFHVDILINIGI